MQPQISTKRFVYNFGTLGSENEKKSFPIQEFFFTSESGNVLFALAFIINERSGLFGHKPETISVIIMYYAYLENERTN